LTAVFAVIFTISSVIPAKAGIQQQALPALLPLPLSALLLDTRLRGCDGGMDRRSLVKKS